MSLGRRSTSLYLVRHRPETPPVGKVAETRLKQEDKGASRAKFNQPQAPKLRS